MNKKAAFYGLFLLVILTAILFRLTFLERRPMHHDEANQAVKFGNLLEKGDYRYDKKEHHGPSLYYLSLPFAWIASGKSFASLNEFTLRLVPALFGVGIIFLLLLLKKAFSPETIILSAIFAAISPVIVFYSRFYIQETLLVFFLVGAIVSGWRYSQNRSLLWLAASGFFCGMMYSTKETSIIAFGAILAAWFLSFFSMKKTSRVKENVGLPSVNHLLAFLGIGVLVSFLMYSSFLKNPRGILDSVLAFGTYFERAGEAGFHSYPWYYYLKMLAYSRYGTGPVWSEALILGLALVGSIAAFRISSYGDSSLLFVRFIFFFTLLETSLYSLISYKTPWNMLPFYIGFLLLAGYGAAVIIKASKKFMVRSLVILALGVGIFNLGFQSYRANFRFYADPRNPYVYAQTSTDFMNLVKRIKELARYHPDHNQMLIKVIANPYETWPLPWYLRSFKRVGYWQEVDAAGDFSDVSLIVSSIDKKDKLEPRLQNNYLSEYYGLRPEVLLALYIRKDLWDRFIQKQLKK